MMLFFAQLANSLVDDHSWESYKCYTLATPTRLRELLMQNYKVVNNKITKKVIEPIIEEINDSLATDLVVKNICQKAPISHDQLKIDISMDPGEIHGTCQFLLDIINKDYKSTCENLIINYAMRDRSKIRMATASKLYFSHLINIGIDARYIQHVIKRHFFSRDIGKCSEATWRRFFSAFSNKTENYHVYISIRENYANVVKKAFPLEIYRSASEIRSDHRTLLPTELFSSSKNLIGYFYISGLDSYSALQTSLEILSYVRAMVFLMPGSLNPSWHKSGFVIRGREKRGIFITERNSPFNKRRRTANSQSFENVSKISRMIFGKLDSERSSHRFLRSISTAALSDMTESRESQLVTLWAAFEALLPELNVDQGARIALFERYIVPAVTINYARNNFSECYRDLAKTFEAPFREFVTLHGVGETQRERFCEIMTSHDNSRRRNLCEIVSASPLALNRLWHLTSKFGDLESINKYLNAHERRVRWQILRIYRERNEIVHAGDHSPFIEGLIENAYRYFVTLVQNVESAASMFGVREVDAVLAAIRLRKSEQDHYRLKLANKDLRDGEQFSSIANNIVNKYCL